MRYVLLLRGINVGGRNKIVMAELRQAVADLGYDKVETYINSGNLFFDSTKNRGDIVAEFQTFFTERYPFVEQFALLDAQDYQAEIDQLPTWWQEEMARKDVLFYTDRSQKALIEDWVSQLDLGEEVVYFGQTALFWGKYDEQSYLQTAYHKKLANQVFYKSLTIRNHKTFAKLAEFLGK
ncbi:DUF1697 domain-containing protein [Streptococcus suis]|uniref:DUF1697 domain-containing protein n=1 Tax=Streptococcus suis TaxID=1307 RepID=UPI001922F32D|nr:DUF1697 domain-containing protein [Streptococcus suis]MBL1125891.1 DUF1697 domain-containing protein [Streptococcus suis]